MGKDTKIEWCDHTFNPWWGCTKVSLGCKNCYAERLAHRYNFDVWGPCKQRRTFETPHWTEPLSWDRAAEKAGKRARVFCGSMCDWCDPDAPESERMHLFNLIENTPNLDWLLLTKRPEAIERRIPKRFLSLGLPSNVWLGASAEDQETFHTRFNLLRTMRHLGPKVLFMSIEPLLGPININTVTPIEYLDWIIVGGESGPHARPMDSAWVRGILESCKFRYIPFFFKGWGEWLPVTLVDGLYVGANGKLYNREVLEKACEKRYVEGRDCPVMLVRFGKKETGNLIDGQQHLELPFITYGADADRIRQFRMGPWPKIDERK